MAGVSLQSIRKVYENDFVAVHGATFDVADGEFLVLVGPSGCGKSTTLHMIAGLESISDGTLRIGERIVNDVPANERDIAMVFQNYALYPHMSVYQNMAFALKLRNVPKAEIDTRVREAAGILDIEPILDRKPRQLSGGQRQRVAVGRAIVRQPQVFLFDEPLSNLDAKLRVQTRKEISRLHRQLDATMIYVTHDQVEAMTMGDRIVVMNAGRIQQIGSPLELYDRPANEFVAAFIGSPSMNLVRGRIERGTFVSDGGLQVELKGAAVPAHEGDVVVGIRPEALHVAGGPWVPEPHTAIETRLDVVEPMGNEIYMYASAGGQELVARVVPQPLPAPDQPLRLAVDLGRLHFFDGATGARLDRSS
ncbi:MAG TPA: sn-glycerol-3-phosphate ABC transporter ATP-binding protein UgpC [Longimicrobiales bacterium]|nr:sn-glycerol-3-phosphate ABC transporter ATP-binding protein UgpC [Longimicrobiales bacterium]